MRLACVVHRYGTDFAGGSEAHCRHVAERLAAHHDVTILTTCAKDHITWRNEYPAGDTEINGVPVRRFSVARQRSLNRFKDASDIAFSGNASQDEQVEWFRENGPDAPELIAYLKDHGGDYDRLLFWAFRYAEVYFGLPLVADRAILVPTAEEDPLIRADIVGEFFSLPAAFIFLTPEEQTLIERRLTGPLPPSVIVGSGLEPAGPRPMVRVESLGVAKPFLLYLGRVDPNKGCEALVQHFVRFKAERDSPVQLVMAGPVNMPIPEHPAIKALGFVDEGVREALLASASLLVVPSRFESLSLVLLEGWNHGLAALVNGHCGVLKGQALRANGALYYHNYDEFAHALDYLLSHRDVAVELGRQGLDYVDREYRWPHVIEKIEALLAQLQVQQARKVR
ncbi:MAG TPA: glycosyltransferase family 4 protein [Vicinamibacterales bacterium]